MKKTVLLFSVLVLGTVLPAAAAADDVTGSDAPAVEAVAPAAEKQPLPFTIDYFDERDYSTKVSPTDVITLSPSERKTITPKEIEGYKALSGPRWVNYELIESGTVSGFGFIYKKVDQPSPQPEPQPDPTPDPQPVPDPQPTPTPDPVPTPDPTPTPQPQPSDDSKPAEDTKKSEDTVKPVPSQDADKGDSGANTLVQPTNNNTGKPAPAKTETKTAAGLPETGEASSITAWIGAMILAAASVVFSFKKKRNN